MTRHALTLVVAIDAGRGIGIDNTMPWHLPEDLAHFKRVTSGHPIIMGRKTFESIGRALPGRQNIVISGDAGWAHAGVDTASSLAAAIALAGGQDAFIIGGAQIFALALEQDVASRMIVTEIERTYACDRFFPPLPPGWVETARERHHSAGDAAAAIAYSFVTYEKAH